MISARQAAWAFAALTAVVVLFQISLALGAPWGESAMGGRWRGAYPPSLRAAALVQGAVLAGFAYVILARAGVTGGGRWTRPAAWGVVGLCAVASVLNLITPSATERMIWAPVATLLLVLSVRVASSR